MKVEKFVLRDQDGNNLIWMEDDSVWLKLKKDDRRRYLGVIHEGKKEFHLSRINSLHTLKKLDAYGFNHALLKNIKVKHIVLYETDVDSNQYSFYKIPIPVFFDKGKFLNFSKENFELQIFLTKDEIKKWKM